MKTEDQISANASEINQSWNPSSTASKEPVELGELIKAKEAAEILGLSSNKITLLHRRGVLRRYNAKYWGGYLKSDIDKLKRAMDRLSGNAAAAKLRRFENEMARENLSKSLKAFSPSEYTKLYMEACGDPTRHMGKLFCKLPPQKGRPTKHDSLYQFPYLSDNDQLDLKTGLLMRDASRKNSASHVRFEVNRITLPPVKNWADPRHSNIVKMLVDAASELYGIDFDTMNPTDYNALAMNQFSTTMMSYVSGRRIVDSAHLLKMLEEAAESGEHLPLVYRIDYWYRSLYSLINTGRFYLAGGTYVDHLVRTMLPPREQDNIRAMADMKDSLDRAVGSYWWELYDSKWLPSYVGELPYIEPRHHKSCYELNPKDKKLHPQFDPSSSPDVVWLRSLNAKQNCEEAPEVTVTELHTRIMHLHTKACVLVEKSRSTNFGVTTAFVKALTRLDVNPTEFFTTPFLSPVQTLQKMDKIEEAFENAAYSLGLTLDEVEVQNVEKQAEEMSVDEHSFDSAISPDGEETVTESDREMNVIRFYEENGFDISEFGSDTKRMLAALDRSQVDDLNRMILSDWGYDI